TRTIDWQVDDGQPSNHLSAAQHTTLTIVTANNVPADLNGDGHSDLIWRSTGGTTVAWLMNGGQKLADVNLNAIPTNWNIQGIGDFNGDGNSDIVWRDSLSGTTVLWEMNGGQKLLDVNLNAIPLDWHIQGIGDFDGDGHSDLVWRNNVGQ